MKKIHYFILLCSLLAAVHGEEGDKEKCYDQTVRYCADKSVKMHHCGAKYGHVGHVQQKLQNYFNLHINTSFNYLLMSTNFGGYVRNREGMEKILRRLSARTWEDAIDLIKYMNKRGVTVKFGPYTQGPKPPTKLNINEIQSLGYALDSQKVIAQEAIELHKKASEGEYYDPEVSSFLENSFLHRHADVIRNMAGLTSDLSTFIKNPGVESLSTFLFDEYLQKL